MKADLVDYMGACSGSAISLRLKAPAAIYGQMMKYAAVGDGFIHGSVSVVGNTPELFMPDFIEADVIYYACDGSTVEPAIVFKSFDKTEVEKYIETHAGKELFLTSRSREDFAAAYKVICEEAIETYNGLVKLGVPQEQAAFILPQGVMVEWVSTGNLRAWSRFFFNVRTDPEVQKETQELAKKIGEIIKSLFPDQIEEV